MIVDDKNRDRLIDDYVLGHMDNTTREEFEVMIQADSELQDEVILIREIRESLIRRNQNIMKMRVMQAKIDATARLACTGTSDCAPAPVRNHVPAVERKGIRVDAWKKIISVVAACLLVCFGISYPYSYSGLQDRGFWDDNVRGGSVDVAEYVENGQYDAALRLLDEEISMRMESMPTAVNPSYIISEVQLLEWTKIQTLLKMRDFERAFEEVAEFRQDAGNYYKKKADKLYKRLKLRLRK